jgi:hypothetical protein
MGGCVYPHPLHKFRKIFPTPLCYKGEEGEDSYYVKKVKIAQECYKLILQENRNSEKEDIILKQAERKLKILKLFEE